ncbi:OPT oligopeptide transporter protein-domain-containing protein [Thelephora terrestris]|uniref:OPT oligopeptide transporter protein-domain-containing protein n=1 Tax=Thelephora terrestris TaxID=56493 RepID=A0A9P6HN86_9AGAM|nr:OPT oligopeptide transporter protein-domain-containing protein [Thelephora terrestris]
MSDSHGPPKEFTVRAVVLGLLIGTLLCYTNLYFGLQTGWVSMMSLQSALIGFLLSRVLASSLTPRENVVVQTTAVATGTMALAAGFVGIIPALGLLNIDQDGIPPIHLSWPASLAWSFAIAYYGILISPPIRKQVIIKEKLPFPSGTATAQLIAVLHKLPPPTEPNTSLGEYSPVATNEGHFEDHDIVAGEPLDQTSLHLSQSWRPLTWSLVLSALITLLAYFFPVVFSIPLFGTYLAREWLWTFSPSLSYIGQGIIMGFPTTISMALGMVVGWAILSPLAKLEGWAPGPVGDMTTGSRGWILWVSLAIMCADSIVSLLPVVAEFATSVARGWTLHETHNDTDDLEVEVPERLVPLQWVLWGTATSVTLGTIVLWTIFGDEGIKPWASLLGYAIGGLLSILAVRALGETDLNPVSGLGKISQLIFAVVQPSNVVANLIAGGVAEAGAQQAGDLMQDLKTGHLIGASPRAQFYGQLIGSTFSIFVTTTAYNIYTKAYEIPGPSFPTPTAYIWLNLARLLRDGSLPEKSGLFMTFFAVASGLVSATKVYCAGGQSKVTKYIPSGVAFAIGFLNTPSFTLARLIGGAIEAAWRTHQKSKGRDGGITLVVVASGFVLGEGVVSIITLVLRSCGIGVWSCWGCGHELCSGCPGS